MYLISLRIIGIAIERLPAKTGRDNEEIVEDDNINYDDAHASHPQGTVRNVL